MCAIFKSIMSINTVMTMLCVDVSMCGNIILHTIVMITMRIPKLIKIENHMNELHLLPVTFITHLQFSSLTVITRQNISYVTLITHHQFLSFRIQNFLSSNQENPTLYVPELLSIHHIKSRTHSATQANVMIQLQLLQLFITLIHHSPLPQYVPAHKIICEPVTAKHASTDNRFPQRTHTRSHQATQTKSITQLIQHPEHQNPTPFEHPYKLKKKKKLQKNN